jgi:hypothetical protein
LVEVDVVPLAEGPIYVSGLEREGIDAIGIESYDVVTGTRTRVRIMVRQFDIAAAREIFERLRRPIRRSTRPPRFGAPH